jgi:hypothetical protein
MLSEKIAHMHVWVVFGTLKSAQLSSTLHAIRIRQLSCRCSEWQPSVWGSGWTKAGFVGKCGLPWFTSKNVSFPWENDTK